MAGLPASYPKNSYLVIAFSIPLLTLNIFLEVLKWRFLVSKLEQIRLIQVLKAVLSGACIGLFTPNRIGDYGGRIFFLKPNHRIKGVLITWLGSITQLFVTIIAGCIALVFYMQRFGTAPLNQLLVYICIMFAALFAYLYFNIPGMYYFFIRFKPFLKYRNYLKVFTYYEPAELLKIFMFSVARYAVFSFQYFLLIYFFTGGIPFFPAFMMIALIFFVQSTLPSFAIAELGIRGAAAVYFLGQLNPDKQGILLAAVILWLTNIMFPAICGLFIILRTKFLN